MMTFDYAARTGMEQRLCSQRPCTITQP